MYKTSRFTIAIIFASLVLSGCEGTRQALGFEDKKGPDEFAVLSKAPLIIPPDFSLRPPAPGQKGPQDSLVRNNARKALVGSSGNSGIITQEEANAAGTSAGELALLRKADAENVDSSIRQLINQETAFLAEDDKTLMERVMFWQKQPEYGTIVDPTKEKKRIQENAALGNAASDGGKTPTIERRKRALLEGFFK
ncbi:MAG: DUF3035 domain-containing protein [Sneathiella sp.]|nr:DUF3035 domain-containing protein [Sneathiella sp.]